MANGDEPVSEARAAGLRYVSDAEPGFRRRRSGRGFAYRDQDGRLIRDARVLARIRSLAIPPAWRDVWICPFPNGHLQATGRDARGRKQYRYHPHWREVRDGSKFHRMLAFGRALPRIRRRVADDLARHALTRERVLAAVVRLLETTLIRVGNEEYAATNRSYGLTTFKNRHAEVTGSRIQFEFRGKGGKEHHLAFTDRRLARIVHRCQDLPGQTLFQYVNGDGNRHAIGSADVNAYLHDIVGEAFTAKDFRTWAATVLAAEALEGAGPFETTTEAKHNVTRAISEVADRLGNTATVCRKSYIHPQVIEAYLDGTLIRELERGRRESGDPDRLHGTEAAVLGLLRRRPPDPVQNRK